MEISPATIRDLGSLHHIEKVCFPKDAWPLLDLIAVLTWPDVVRLKAVEDSLMIGFVAGDPRSDGDLAWIATIGVLPEYRRRGIGRALLHACEAKLSHSRIRLCVRASNEGAIAMYKQEGYNSADIWHEYYNDKESALVMEKVRR